MKQEFKCQMNNKFEGWAPSDFKHLCSENIPEPRHATAMKTIIVIDRFLTLHKVHLFCCEQVYWWLCESSLIKSQLDAYPTFLVNPCKQNHNISKKETCDLLRWWDKFHLLLLQDSLYSKNQVSKDTFWKYASFTPCVWYINDYKMLNEYLRRKKNPLPKGKRKLGTDPEEQ